jgi:hypothetical protein
VKFKVYIELERVDGPEQDEDTMLDAFCGTIGRDNGAREPLRITAGSDEPLRLSVYEVKLADDRLLP